MKLDKIIKSSDSIKENLNSLDVGKWSFSDEREFMENLFVGRFNYFLVVFSLFMTAGFANSFDTWKSIVFLLGAIVLLFAWFPLYRAYRKHDLNLRILFNSMEKHPAYNLEKILQAEGFKPKYKVSKWMGIYIPLVCIAILIIIAILIALDFIKNIS